MTTHDDPGKSDSGRRARATTGRVIVPLLLLLGFGAAQVARQYHQAGVDAPTSAQRIYAALIEWGADTSDLIPPVDQADIDRRLAQLWSRDGEDRVRAAQWLSARGVRDAGDEIAASMLNSGTIRPCQLAHSLGHLGDERWVGELVAAANQTSNTDLRVCATMGLRSLASDQACEALIDLARRGEAPTLAIEALGVIGRAAALGPLRDIVRSSASEHEQRAARLAVLRIELLSSEDPIPSLAQRLTDSLRSGRADEWALRWMARKADHRSIAPLAAILRDAKLDPRDRERIAAALLAHGEPGRQALVEIASTDARGRSAAQAALSLTHRTETARPAQLPSG